MMYCSAGYEHDHGHGRDTQCDTQQRQGYKQAIHDLKQATGVQSRLSHGQTTAICSVSYGLQARLAPMNVIDGAYRQITFVNTLRGGLASTAPKAPKLTGSTQCLITARWRKTKSYDTELRTLM
jgi:hypothetical protein